MKPCTCTYGLPSMKRDCPRHGHLIRNVENEPLRSADAGNTDPTGLRSDTGSGDSWLNEFHRVNAARQHEAFAPPHTLLGLVACAAEEIGEMAGAALGVTGEKRRKAHLTNADILDGVADAITYLSLIADRCGCTDLQGLLGSTFNMVSERAGSKLFVPTAQPAAQEQKEEE